MDQSYQSNMNTKIKLLIIALLVVVIGFITIITIRSSHFNIIGTSPGVGDIATNSPFLRINFNKPLSKSDVAVSSNPSSAITSYSVNNKTLEIVLNGPLDSKTKYTITFGVSSTDGHKITNNTISFTPKATPINDLSRDQQNYINNREVNLGTTFDGVGTLSNLGITAAQINGLTGAFSKFAPKAKAVIIDTASVVQAPHDKNSSRDDFITFTVKIDNTSYNAKIEYAGLADIHLYLYDQKTGGVVYDSGILGTLE
jgi:methionine-rich copper-binding protein CopC